MRLQPPERQIAGRESWRQADNAELWPAHHDALEFPDGQVVLLTFLCERQQATVLQLPAEPKTPRELENQKRGAYVD